MIINYKSHWLHFKPLYLLAFDLSHNQMGVFKIYKSFTFFCHWFIFSKQLKRKIVNLSFFPIMNSFFFFWPMTLQHWSLCFPWPISSWHLSFLSTDKNFLLSLALHITKVVLFIYRQLFSLFWPVSSWNWAFLSIHKVILLSPFSFTYFVVDKWLSFLASSSIPISPKISPCKEMDDMS